MIWTHHRTYIFKDRVVSRWVWLVLWSSSSVRATLK